MDAFPSRLFKTMAHPVTYVFPTFHDGHLLGIQLEDGQARLFVKDVLGQPHEVTLTGLRALNIDGFREGNIISETLLFQRAEPDATALEKLFPSPHPDAAAHYHERHAAFLKSRIALVEAGEAVVFWMCSSYGAEIVAMCDTVAVRPGDETIGTGGP